MKIQIILNDQLVKKSFSSKEDLVSYLNKNDDIVKRLEKKYAKEKIYSCKNVDELFAKAGI